MAIRGAGGSTPPHSPIGVITQIYEGTNQVERIVMARQLLAGVQSDI